MTHLQMLASSARPLAEVLVDALRAGLATRLPKNPRPRSANDSDRSQFDLWVGDKPGGTADDGAVPILRPDEAAAAVLLGQALDRQRDVLARLQDPDTVAIVEVPAAEFIEPVAGLLCNHVLGPDAPVLDSHSLEKEATIAAAAGSVAIFKPKDQDKAGKASTDSAEFAAAVQQRWAVIGIAVDPDRELPRDLVRMAEHRIVVPPLDASAVAAVIEVVTGRRPGAIDEELGRRATLAALNIAVRGDLGAERSLARLRRLIEASDRDASKGPVLSENHIRMYW